MRRGRPFFMFSVSTKKMPEKKCRMPNIPNTTRFSIDEVYNLYYDKRATGIYQFPIIARSRRNGGLRIMQERALYKTIRDDLLRGIENGSLRPDQALPSERELCQRYGTSRMTARHAVAELESLGSVYRIQGKGTFVSGQKLIQPLMQVSGFTEDMAKRGKKAGSRLLFAGEKKADAAIARGLRIAPGEPYILIRRLRLADGVPMAIENTALNASLCRGILDTALTISLIFLYTGVGVSLGENKEVFQYIKRLGARVLFMPAAIFAGCICGGLISGLLLGLPLSYSVISASGMGYYSLTGAFMTETFGIEAGTYGFIVNVSRDVFTVALLPILSKISKGSPIASGAAGCMDTMLVPVTKAVGPELGMVALISGTILTFVVPVWLPVIWAFL